MYYTHPARSAIAEDLMNTLLTTDDIAKRHYVGRALVTKVAKEIGVNLIARNEKRRLRAKQRTLKNQLIHYHEYIISELDKLEARINALAVVNKESND